MKLEEPDAATPPTDAPRRRAGRKADVTREDWLETGLRELGERGPGALTLDSLCRKLGITKGSFYWYFANRAEFMQQLLEAWERHHTLALIEHVEETGGTPLEKLHHLFRAANAGYVDFRAEQAIRHWGHRDEAIRRMLHTTDRKRIDYTAGLFEALGSDPALARVQSDLLYALIFGEAMTYRREARPQRLERQDAALQAIIGLSGPAPRPRGRQKRAKDEAR